MSCRANLVRDFDQRGFDQWPATRAPRAPCRSRPIRVWTLKDNAVVVGPEQAKSELLLGGEAATGVKDSVVRWSAHIGVHLRMSIIGALMIETVSSPDGAASRWLPHAVESWDARRIDLR